MHFRMNNKTLTFLVLYLMSMVMPAKKFSEIQFTSIMTKEFFF